MVFFFAVFLEFLLLYCNKWMKSINRKRSLLKLYHWMDGAYFDHEKQMDEAYFDHEKQMDGALIIYFLMMVLKI